MRSSTGSQCGVCKQRFGVWPSSRFPWIIKSYKTVPKLHLWLLNNWNINQQKCNNAARQSGSITVLAVLAELFVKSTLRYCIVGFVTFLLNPGPTTACRKSMSHSQPLFVAGRHINTLLHNHVKEITSHILAWLFSSCSQKFRSWNRLNSKHFLSINMQQS